MSISSKERCEKASGIIIISSKATLVKNRDTCKHPSSHSELCPDGNQLPCSTQRPNKQKCVHDGKCPHSLQADQMVSMIAFMLKCTPLCNYSTLLPVAKTHSTESTLERGCKLWVGRNKAHWVTAKREGKKVRTSSLNFRLMSPPETQTPLQISSFGSLQKQSSNPLFKLKFIASAVIPVVLY